ncbi:(3R)-3-hydroxyacyl-CoA dehydrogenase-like [Oratosquilla oratoria]|uniref:(3R)-3-hydroxyacyl-CoA dehydrogenase-like n=1 Tax=Oratosquilla oratoria TaxID=337810 RepID=UPI003F77566B
MESKLALVTGGASGIGRAICRQLDREGARVAVADLNLSGALETVNMLKNPENHLAVHMDVANKESVTSGLDSVKKVFGAPPTLLAHCAGYLHMSPLVVLPEEEFDRMIKVNLKGTFLVTQALAKVLLDAGLQKEGSFVLISSVEAHRFTRNTGHYSVSKSGVLSLSRSFAGELAGDGIRVNSVLPGLIETSIMGPEMMKLAIKGATQRQVIKRVGQPEDVAEIVVFLLSDKSGYVTGAEYKIDGGYQL